MPWEAAALQDRPVPFAVCPHCGAAFVPFLRGTVQRRRYRWIWIGPWDYCALICDVCKTIVGHERP